MVASVCAPLRVCDMAHALPHSSHLRHGAIVLKIIGSVLPQTTERRQRHRHTPRVSSESCRSQSPRFALSAA